MGIQNRRKGQSRENDPQQSLHSVGWGWGKAGEGSFISMGATLAASAPTRHSPGCERGEFWAMGLWNMSDSAVYWRFTVLACL